MKIVILGASGKTGRILVHEALEAGHKVTAFVRDINKVTRTNPNLKIVVGDARRSEDLAKALEGADAVISTLGSSRPGDNLIVASAKALIDAMHKTGVERVIMMSSFLASPNFRQGGATRF